MSTRHLFPSADGLVNKALRGIVAYNPSLSLDEAHRVVFDSAHDRAKVSLISGGGSGHEPAWTGYVGTNMLAAAVQGDIFASPSARLVGQHGLAGHVGVLKVLGGAAGAGASLDAVHGLGEALAAQTVSMAASLDRCHVPGRGEHAALAADAVDVGTGPHNEPGHRRLSPVPPAPELVRLLLRGCLDEADPERGYVRVAPGDETLLLVSNLGGISHLEMAALVDEVLEQLTRDWHVEPVRVCAGFFETSLNAPAFCVSVVNLSAAARGCRFSAADMKRFLDVRTTTAWEAVAGSQARRRPRREQLVARAPRGPPLDPLRDPPPAVDGRRDGLRVDPAALDRMLRAACRRLVDAEPDLTRWDSTLGDGDCGETLRTGAARLLAALDHGLARSGSVVRVLRAVEDIVEGSMGGTLGGILAIFFVALRAAVERHMDVAASRGPAALWAEALSAALDSLRRYTPATVGDRTVMDTLIPFTRTMRSAGFGDAVAAAVRGAEATRAMKPRLGRATYVGQDSGEAQELPPDPGAWGAMVAIRGLHSGL